METLNFKDKTILVIFAHPDDAEFTSAGTIAKAVKEGAIVYYLVATQGDKGTSDLNLTSEELANLRQKEQEKAAQILGVKKVEFLGYSDGELEVNLSLKEKIVKAIRAYKPDIVISQDPSKYYYLERGLVNHPDHRALGEAVIDAVYPLARDHLQFLQHFKEGIGPHRTRELWLFAFEEQNFFVDIAETIDLKIKALMAHQSQVEKPEEMEKRMRERAANLGKQAGLRFAEGFKRLVLP
jgi:LmbE family N-acetylglucosaminyl deacetylase